MATYARKLKDSSGNYIAPATRSTNVFMNNNNTVEETIASINSKITSMNNTIVTINDAVKTINTAVNRKPEMLDVYPIDTIFFTFTTTSPASLFGGEWEKLENTFLYGSGTKSVGDTGGEETHLLTVTELAEHTHSLATGTGGGNTLFPAWASPNAIGGPSNNFSANAATTGYISAGSKNQPHNNMPPYTVCNIWRRVA